MLSRSSGSRIDIFRRFAAGGGEMPGLTRREGNAPCPHRRRHYLLHPRVHKVPLLPPPLLAGAKRGDRKRRATPAGEGGRTSVWGKNVSMLGLEEQPRGLWTAMVSRQQGFRHMQLFP